MSLCAVCHRQARGYGWFNPLLGVSDPRRHQTRKRFCSAACQTLWAEHKKGEGFSMIDPTKDEKRAMESALQPLGEYVSEIGMHRPLQDYSREEVLTLIEVIVTAYQDDLINNFLDTSPMGRAGRNA